MSRLITFGCSLTFGQHLDDRESESWPAQLGKNLNLSCDNQGINGASNKHIWWKIINYNFLSTDVVCILWTHLDRWCVIKPNGVTPINQWEVDNNTMARQFYDHLHDQFDMTTQTILMMEHIQMFLNKSGIKQIHLLAETFESKFSWHNCKIAPIDISKIRTQYPLANDNHHPGPQAYKEFAKQIYRHYTKEINE